MQSAHTTLVGYAQTALKAGNTAVGSQFVPMQGNVIDLADLVAVGYEDGVCEGTIWSQKVDEGGGFVGGSDYYWYDIPDESDPSVKVMYGWYDGGNDLIVRGDCTVQVAEGFWVEGTADTEGIQSSGQVANAPVQVFLKAGNTFVINNTPVAVNWGDDNEDGKFLAAAGYEDDVCEGTIWSQKVDEGGGFIGGSDYYWYDIPDESDPSVKVMYGWYDGGNDPVSGVTLAPGEGIWVEGTSTDEYLSFPAAL